MGRLLFRHRDTGNANPVVVVICSPANNCSGLNRSIVVRKTLAMGYRLLFSHIYRRNQKFLIVWNCISLTLSLKFPSPVFLHCHLTSAPLPSRFPSLFHPIPPLQTPVAILSPVIGAYEPAQSVS